MIIASEHFDNFLTKNDQYLVPEDLEELVRVLVGILSSHG
jgi:hypothetical protein